MDPLQFAAEVERAILKCALDRTEDEKNDLRQQCYLELLRLGDIKVGRGLAYRVCETTIYNFIESQTNIFEPNKQPGPGEARGRARDREEAAPTIESVSISQREIFQEAENANTIDQSADIIARLDLAAALARLPEKERELIEWSYGLNCKQLSRKAIAEKVGKSEAWVYGQSKMILRKLRALMVAKEKPHGHGSKNS